MTGTWIIVPGVESYIYIIYINNMSSSGIDHIHILRIIMRTLYE